MPLETSSIYRISLNNVPPWLVSFLKKLRMYIKKENYSYFCTFEIASLVNVPGHYLRKYGKCENDEKFYHYCF